MCGVHLRDTRASNVVKVAGLVAFLPPAWVEEGLARTARAFPPRRPSARVAGRVARP